MTIKHFACQLKNKRLIKSLEDKGNVQSLEFLLNEEGKRLHNLQRLKKGGKIDFGPSIPKEDLSSVFYEIKKEVDSFLNTQSVGPPKHRYFNIFKPGLISTPVLLEYIGGISFLSVGVVGAVEGIINNNPNTTHKSLLFSLLGVNFLGMGGSIHNIAMSPEYNPLTKTITLSKKKRIEIIPTIAHEYTHHIQKLSGINYIFEKQSVFMEGHARGVERHIANTYRKKEDNEAFLYRITDITFGELKSVYLWMCKKLSISSNKSLTKTKSSISCDETLSKLTLGRPTYHAFGNALFYLHEIEKGHEIYQDVLNRTFELS